MKILSKTIYWLVVAVLILIASLTAISTFKITGNYKLLAVKSGSMSPFIQMGSVVIVKPDKEYKKDDIITFINPDTPKNSKTHRVFEVKDDEDKISFITKGDANEEADIDEVESSWVLGKVIGVIPFLGFPVSFAKTLHGLILLIIIPGVIIVCGELRNIKNEIQNLLKARVKKKK